MSGADATRVATFHPENGQALDNIPHMLRYWADTIARDQAAGVEFEVVSLVMLQRNSASPAFVNLGAPRDAPAHPLLVAAMFDACRAKMQRFKHHEEAP